MAGHAWTEQERDVLRQKRLAAIARGIACGSGDKSPHWKGGRIKRGEYIYVKRPDHPHASKQGYVAEHRLVMEMVLGRFLEARETVHHINHDKADNRPENLMVVGNHGEHIRDHHRDVMERAWASNRGRRPNAAQLAALKLGAAASAKARRRP